ncbi:hypothetical protein [Thomasclavelia ramosa]|uniref:hypothetical protein n=1 Tax=Thomasclavelia ramosa TaxID=1547 RepID=UPI00233F0DBC|nr:hypothetical protein [Thomasclavelia ramosa]MDC2832590.1 hypothetical protein [Thomasclavelia ramosa]
MENEQDWKFDKDKASKALQTLSCHVNPFRDENVAELVRVISYCMDLEQALDKACEELETFDMTFNDGDFVDIKNKEQWKEWLKNDNNG